MQFNSRYNTYIFFSLSIMILIYLSIFFHIYDVQFMTHDDINHYVSDYKNWVEAAHLQGRIEFYIDGIYQHILLANTSYVYYRSWQIFTIIAIIFSLGFFINILLREKYIGYLYMILLATLWQNSVGHNLIGSYPLYKGMAFVFFLASLMTFIKYIRTNTKKYLIASLIFWSITLRGSEFWVVYVPFFIIFGFYELENNAIFKRIYKSVTVSKWHILLLIISTIVYYLFRENTSGGFSSNIMQIDSIPTVISTWIKYTFGLTPGIQFYLNADFKGYDYLLALIDFQILFTVGFSFVLMIMVRRYIEDTDISKKSIFVILIAGIYGIFAPNFLISLTYKYQYWAEGSAIIDYLYSSFSYFAIVLILFLILLLLRRNPKRYIYFSLFISILILGTLLNNKYIGNLQEEDNRKLFFLDAFLYSSYSKTLGDKPILFSNLSVTPISAIDLNRLAKKRGKVDLNFIEQGEANNMLVYFGAQNHDKDETYMIYVENNITKAIFTSSKRCNEISPCYIVGTNRNTLNGLPKVTAFSKENFQYRDINLFELNEKIPFSDISSVTIYNPETLYKYSQAQREYQIEFLDGIPNWVGGYGQDAWSDGNVTARIYNKSNFKAKREIKFTLGTFEKRNIFIYIDGKLMKEVSLQAQDFQVPVKLTLELNPGKTLMELKTDTSAMLPNNGYGKKVTFLISNVSYIE